MFYCEKYKLKVKLVLCLRNRTVDGLTPTKGKTFSYFFPKGFDLGTSGAIVTVSTNKLPLLYSFDGNCTCTIFKVLFKNSEKLGSPARGIETNIYQKKTVQVLVQN